MSTVLKTLALSIGSAALLSKYVASWPLGVTLTSILLFVSIILSRLVWSGTVYPLYFSPFKDIPMAPGGEFLLGHTRIIMREASGLPARHWIEQTPNNGMIRYINWFRERLLITDAKVLKEMLGVKSYEFVKPEQVRHGLARILGRGVLFAEGDEHKIQRKNLLPAFAFRHVKDLYPIFWEKAGDLIEAVSEASRTAARNAGGAGTEKVVAADAEQHAPGAIEVGGWVSRSTLDIIGVSGMDRDFNALRDPDNELSVQYRNVLNPSRTARYLGVLAFFLPRWFVDRIPVKDNQNVWVAADYVKKVCRDMVVSKRQRMSEQKTTRPDIISIALQSGLFNDEELVNQMMTFLIAGHETTASAMSWAILMLCRNPAVQTKLRNAVREKIPSLRSNITHTDIDDCHYLNAFCSELLRLWPPVTMTLRVAAKDTSLNGHFVPKDTLVILSPMAINASKDLWGPDAEEFKPERWLDNTGRANNSGGADSAYSFLTFLHGPRACIGQKFAEAEFACLVAAWVGRFNTTLEEGSPHATGFPEIKGGVTSRPKGGVYVHLTEIDGW